MSEANHGHSCRGGYPAQTAGGRRHAGDSFELARDVPHAERYGPQGAAYWVARRNG